MGHLLYGDGLHQRVLKNTGAFFGGAEVGASGVEE